MNPATETSAEGTEGLCPGCGAPLAAHTLAGVCARCFAKGALAEGTGWLAPGPDMEEHIEGEGPPEVIGWRLGSLLGAGGMGRVYQAEAATGDGLAAIKIMDTRWSRDPVARARFEAEAIALRQLRHPHVIQILDFTETTDGRFCLVMELVEGCDLGRLLRVERLPPERAVEIFEKVCAAVSHAHARGLAHRDIKPGNILIGREGVVKLVDFGLAKDLDQEGGEPTHVGALTLTTDHFGSAYYLAPERFQAGQSSAVAADIYALGVLLYHLLAGRMPLGNYTPLSKLTGLPQDVDRVVAGALEADPARRTRHVESLLEGMQAVWRRHVNGAGRARRRRVLVGALGAFVAAVGLAGAGALWQQQRALPASAAFPEATKATPQAPWTNSLGMKFVPVPGTRVLFSIWEARRQDVEPFLYAEKDLLDGTWREGQEDKLRRDSQSIYTLTENRRLAPGGSWFEPGFEVTPQHPAFFVTIRDAQRYCLWLTWKERVEGRLQEGQHYRLPTHAEWLTACGGEKAPLREGNMAGPEARDGRWPPGWPTLERRDPFPRTSPVGSFPPEAHGLYDMSGNVTEWVLDHDENFTDPREDSTAQLRGPAFNDGTPLTASFAHLRKPQHQMRLPNVGFRLVLALEAPEKSARP